MDGPGSSVASRRCCSTSVTVAVSDRELSTRSSSVMVAMLSSSCIPSQRVSNSDWMRDASPLLVLSELSLRRNCTKAVGRGRG